MKIVEVNVERQIGGTYNVVVWGYKAEWMAYEKVLEAWNLTEVGARKMAALAKSAFA